MVEIREKMQRDIQILWLTDEIESIKPTVIDEVWVLIHSGTL